MLIDFVRAFLGSSIDDCGNTGIAKCGSNKGVSNLDPEWMSFAVQIILGEELES